MKVVASVSVRV